MNTENYWRRKTNREWWERRDRDETHGRIRENAEEERPHRLAGCGYDGRLRRSAPASVAVKAALLMVGLVFVIEILSAGIRGLDGLSLGAVGLLAAILVLALAKSYARAWIRHVPTATARRRPTIPLLAGATAGGLVSLALSASGITQPLVDLCRGLLAL